jgi:hypothetical protein
MDKAREKLSALEGEIATLPQYSDLPKTLIEMKNALLPDQFYTYLMRSHIVPTWNALRDGAEKPDAATDQKYADAIVKLDILLMHKLFPENILTRSESLPILLQVLGFFHVPSYAQSQARTQTDTP